MNTNGGCGREGGSEREKEWIGDGDKKSKWKGAASVLNFQVPNCLNVMISTTTNSALLYRILLTLSRLCAPIEGWIHDGDDSQSDVSIWDDDPGDWSSP